jgi:hypothetical protein
MPEFFYRVPMKVDILKNMDSRIREDDDLATQLMIHYKLQTHSENISAIAKSRI